jgi:hypothetical protein
MPKDSNILCMLVAAAVIVCAILYLTKTGSIEGYIDKPLTSVGEMKRTPVNYAFVGDGMSGNPHFQADPTNKLVPLEYGTVDLWSRGSYKMPPVVTRATQLIADGNRVADSKLRLDMVESGDMGWHRFLNNIPQSHHLSKDGRPLDADAVNIDYSEEPLYSPIYHYDHYLGF